jgi:predicted DNA-binding transcriptional regulator YafY
MRADRLVAALLVLQARGRITAPELARELEVSVKTARRDLEALMMAGVPIFPKAGRGGGWELVGGARTDLTGLTAAEARALFLATGPTSSLGPAARSALRKVLQAVPGPFREQAAAASRAIAVDDSRWGEHERRPPPAHLDALQDAVIDSRQVRLAYVDGSGAATERLVDPLGLVDKSGVWYLLAGTPAGQRTFRLDRIRELERTDAPAARPAGFELASAWAEVVDEVERRRIRVRARVLAEPAVVRSLRGTFGRHLVVGARQDGGRVEVSVGAAVPEMLAWQLAGWGARLEVLEPDSVRSLLAAIGHELAERYGDVDGVGGATGPAEPSHGVAPEISFSSASSSRPARKPQGA